VYFGADLGGTKIAAVLLDARGRTLWQQRQPTPQGDYDATLQALVTLVQAAEAHCGQTVAKVGVGGPGTLTASGVVKNANSVWLNGKPLQADLHALLQRPVRYANDANCLAQSEATDGAAAGASSVFAVILGTGVGAGLHVNGRLHSGPNGLAGEWGHNPLPWATAQDPAFACYCGQALCNETLLSGPGLARDHLQATGQALTGEAIVAAAAAGSAAAQATLRRHSHRLARALAAVINLLDPEVIVLGGGLSRLAHLYTDVPALWAQWVVSGGVKDAVRTRLVAAQHGDASGVRGAAWLWREAG
jgi:fructokinase